MTAAVLFIGGMDSSGGAGLLRDTVTAAALGLPCRVAVTAVTAQSDQQVAAVQPIHARVIAAQIASAAESGIGAAKIGMLTNRAVVEAVAAALPPMPLVVDPVLRSSSGHDLLDAAGIEALLKKLLPRTTLLTPNLPELAVLATRLGFAPGSREELVAGALLSRGCGAVLVKGGHATAGVCEDRLYRAGQPRVAFRAPRIAAELRGTGCQLASAIAGHLSMGHSLQGSVRRAKEIVGLRLANSLIPPAKQSLPDRTI